MLLKLTSMCLVQALMVIFEDFLVELVSKRSTIWLNQARI